MADEMNFIESAAMGGAVGNSRGKPSFGGGGGSRSDRRQAAAAAAKLDEDVEDGDIDGDGDGDLDGDGDGEGSGGEQGSHELREQDRFLPFANVARIMKKAIPVQSKIAKDARECVQECVSEFISFITSEASDRCLAEKRKTINGEDILFAMSTLGFDNYVEPLKLYLQKYRESVKGDKVQIEGFGEIPAEVLNKLASQQPIIHGLVVEHGGHVVLAENASNQSFQLS